MKKISYILFLLVCLVHFDTSYGQNVSIDKIIKSPPSPQKFVNDYTGTLTDLQKSALENKLMMLDDSTFTQIVVVIVSTLDGMDVADAAIELGRNWGVGNKKNNSGVILLIALDDRKLNISPGYGLEAALTDVEASGIIEDVIKPNFKVGNYYRGIDEGSDAIIEAVKGEYHVAHARKGKGVSAGRVIFIIILIIIFLISSSRGGGKGGSFMSRRGYRGFGSPFLWGAGSGGWGGGGGGGSSGGGGFGGFGGGSFGGGGASGSW